MTISNGDKLPILRKEVNKKYGLISYLSIGQENRERLPTLTNTWSAAICRAADI